MGSGSVCAECGKFFKKDNVIKRVTDPLSERQYPLETAAEFQRLVKEVRMSVATCNFCDLVSELVNNHATPEEVVSIRHIIEETLVGSAFKVRLEFVGRDGNELGSDTVGIWGTSGKCVPRLYFCDCVDEKESCY